ncbi:MAG TPA: hypothetical protein VFV60_01745 [bacterium]|nr:hypothetical protein [bacterium]
MVALLTARLAFVHRFSPVFFFFFWRSFAEAPSAAFNEDGILGDHVLAFPDAVAECDGVDHLVIGVEGFGLLAEVVGFAGAAVELVPALEWRGHDLRRAL